MGVPRSLAGAAAALLLGGLTACGGGGGGGDGSNPTPLQYNGNTNAAVITSSNASALAAVVIGGGDVASATASLTAGNEAQGGQGQLEIGRRLIHTVRATVTRPGGNARAARAAIDQTNPCPEGGTVRIFGDVTPTGAGTVTVVYMNCTVAGDSLTGQATMRIDLFSAGIPVNYTLTFDRLAMRGVTNSDMTGSVHVVTDIPTNTETASENIVSLYIGTGRMTKSENLVFVDVYDNVNDPTSFAETVTGRMFDSVHGYVDVATLARLFFSPATLAFPNGGLLQLTGAQNRRIQLTHLSSDMVRLALDLDADGLSETVAMLTRAQLAGPVGADLADSDGDGLHNGWESAFGPTDPAADGDADGFSSLSEYNGGGNPNDAATTPGLVTGILPAANDVAVANSDMGVPGKASIASDGKNYLIVSCRPSGSPPAIVVGINYGLLVSDMGQVLSNFPISTYFCAGNAVGFDGSNYLVVLPRDGGLRGMRVSPSGAILTSGTGFEIASTADSSSNARPAVAFDGANYLVVWNKFVSGNARIHAARVSPAGVVLDNFAVTSGPSGLDFDPAVAFGGGNYLVAWTSGATESENVFGARVSPAGAVLDAPVPIATAAGGQLLGGIASDGTNFLVVWNQRASATVFPPADGRIFGRRIAPDMTLLDGAAGTEGIAISTGLFQNHSSSVTFAGSSFLVTWAVSSFPNFPPAGIYAARISRNGVRLDGPAADLGVAVSGAPRPFSRFVHPVAGSSGRSALIVWVDNTELSGTFKDVLAALVYGP
jgi:hypothetical protein